jgi:hypothetical protein
MLLTSFGIAVKVGYERHFNLQVVKSQIKNLKKEPDQHGIVSRDLPDRQISKSALKNKPHPG